MHLLFPAVSFRREKFASAIASFSLRLFLSPSTSVSFNPRQETRNIDLGNRHQSFMAAMQQRHGVRIFLVDDNATVRRILRTLLESNESWTICDEASNGWEAVARFDREKFDVVVLDLQMPAMNGLETAKRITARSPATKILMVTLHCSPQLADEARRVGIRGLCGKSDISELVEGIERILNDQPYFKS